MSRSFFASLGVACTLAASGLAHGAVGSLADGNGTIVAWGWDADGKVSTTPGPGDYISIAAGGAHNLAIKANGKVEGWGRDDEGQIDDQEEKFVKVSGGGRFSVGILTDGTLKAWGENYEGTASDGGEYKGSVSGPEHATGTFLDVAAGGQVTVALRSDGSLVAWGLNDVVAGTPPPPTPEDNFKYIAVAAGNQHAMALRDDGTLVAWGVNQAGGTDPANGSVEGPKASTDTFVAIAMGNYQSLALRADGTLAIWGRSQLNITSAPFDKEPFGAIAAGGAHSIAIRADGSLVVWGHDSSGALTLSPAAMTGTYVAIDGGDYHSIAMRARTEYNDGLLVEGYGVKRNLNRDINVTGDVQINTTMMLYNNADTKLPPTMNVTGHTTVDAAGGIHGEGTINSNLTNHGTITGTGAGLNLNGQIDGAGDFLGTVVFSGVFSPGNSPAIVNLENPVFTSGNVLVLQLGGTTPGSEHDQLNITGTATLGGTLQIEFINGYMPTGGDVFQLWVGNVTGTFDEIILPELANPLLTAWDSSQLLTAGTLSVLSIPEPASAMLMAAGAAIMLRRRRS